MSTIEINHSYTITMCDQIELPNDLTGEDIKDWHIKWGTIYITLKNGNSLSFESDSDISGEAIDWKRPSCVAIHNVDEIGNVDYDVDYGN